MLYLNLENEMIDCDGQFFKTIKKCPKWKNWELVIVDPDVSPRCLLGRK